MKITVIGTRGIPSIQGGVETHCEELYERVVALGVEVTVVRRSCYVETANRLSDYKGVKLVDLFAPRFKCVEAIVHSLLGVLYARFHATDVLHVHAIGPSIVIPFARLLGLRVVMTHHGFDYRRQKWGAAARFVLRLGERWGSRYSHQTIVISKEIECFLAERYRCRNLRLIPNGVAQAEFASSSSYIETLGLRPRQYVLAVGRIVEEKGFDLLIEAFFGVSPKGIRLVIAGEADHESTYSSRLKQMAAEGGVVMAGFVKGNALQQLFSHAALFVLPSYHEGLPIVLLEAMSYRLPVLASDIEANGEVALPSDCYFECGNVASLIHQLKRRLELPFKLVDYDLRLYNWDSIAKRVYELYGQVMRGERSGIC